MKYSALVATFTAVALIAGCSHSDQPTSANASPMVAQTAPTNATAPTVIKPTSPAVVSTEPTTTAQAPMAPRFLPVPIQHGVTTQAAFKQIGIAACDQFGIALHQCLPNMRGIHRENSRRMFESQLDRWQKALNSGTSAADIATQCTAYSTRMRSQLRSMGCRL